MKIKSALVGGSAAVAGAAASWAALTMLPGTLHAQLAPALLTNGKTAVITPAMREAAGMQSAFNQVANEAGPAVVTITTIEHIKAPTGRFRQFPGFGGGDDPFGGLFPQFGNPGRGSGGNDGGDDNQTPNGYEAPGGGGAIRSGLGSGFIVRDDGLILTNAHVVQGADTVTVKLSDGREFKNAKVLGSDEESDVAVIKIGATNLPTVPLGDSSDVNVGDWAVAVGNPYGLDHTVTVGVISAKGREMPAGGDSKAHGEFLQTDASINPGNSGGPLLDIYGKVIGINNSIYSENGGNVGIGFAVPINTARKIGEELARTGTIRRARLNMEVAELTPASAQSLGLDPNTKGVLIDSVIPGGPGAKAGLQPGDVITGVNGKPVTKSNEMIAVVSDTPAGGSVSLDVLRNGAHQTITAQPTELKNGQAAKAGAGDSDAQATSALGIRYAPLTAELAQQLGVDINTKGVVISGVANGSPAQDAGLQAGMIIERVGQTPVSTPDGLRAAVKAILAKETGDKSVALFVSAPAGNGQRIERYVFVQPQ